MGLRSLVAACSSMALLAILWLGSALPGAAADLQIAIFHPKTDAFAVPSDRWMEISVTAFSLVAEAQGASVARQREQGANIYLLSDAERARFQEASRAVYDEIRKTVGEHGRKLLDLTARYRQ